MIVSTIQVTEKSPDDSLCFQARQTLKMKIWSPVVVLENYESFVALPGRLQKPRTIPLQNDGAPILLHERTQATLDVTG